MRYFVTLAGRTIEVDLSGSAPAVNGREVAAELVRVPGTPFRHLLADGESLSLAAEAGERRGAWRLTWGSRSFDVEVVDERTRTIREMTGASEAAADQAVRAPMPGLVLRVEVEVGQAVHSGQGVVIVEAMKMENELKAPADGVVASIAVRAGQTVEKNEVLLLLE